MKSTLKVPSALMRLAAAASAAALAGCGRRAETPAEQTVAVARAERTTLSNSMTLQAEFMPFQDVLIHAKVSGYVNPIRVDIGDHVKAGDVIAQLEVPELGDQLQGALATERRAEAEHQVAHLDNERLIGVSKGQPNLVAQQDLDAAAAKDAATEAALADARADADRFRTLVAYTHVTAPFSGIITKRFVDNGALVEAGTSSNTEPIVELAQSNLLRLRFPVPEAETPLVRDGGQVTVSIGALGRTFKAPIARNSWGIDRSTRTMVVEVDVPNKDEALKAGMYASVTLPLESASGAIAVPLGAVPQGAHPSVLVVAADGKLVERPVETGMRTASLVEIRSGLAEGERVVVGERSGLVAGETVGFKDVGIPQAQ
ncbi:MAG TPA: efflux RND transporter periplasmic adaptor subunit [Opitutaceae bacterium]|jgi:RND family efflux transporter MFP subunit